MGSIAGLLRWNVHKLGVGAELETRCRTTDRISHIELRDILPPRNDLAGVLNTGYLHPFESDHGSQSPQKNARELAHIDISACDRRAAHFNKQFVRPRFRPFNVGNVEYVG